MQTKVSILIPVYNTSSYLAKCLDSVLGQTYSELEVIVVNDGSTDNSLDILESYAHKHRNLKVINKPNGGLQSARKVGIQNATGDFIAFVDSDDTLPSTYVIETLVDAIMPQTQIVVGRVNIDNGAEPRLFPSSVFTTISAQEYLLNYLICGKVSWNLVAKLFSRSLINSTVSNPINVSAGEDALYTISLANAATGTVTMVNKPVYNYYVRPGSITQSRNTKYIYDNFKVADYIDNLLKDRVDTKYRVAFRLLCMSNSFRYGWLGRRNNINADAIRRYQQTSGVLPLFAPKKRLQIWILIHFGDLLSTIVFKNRIHEKQSIDN